MSADGPAATPSFETDLIARIQAGQTEAETELYEKYSSRVYYLSLRETGSKEDAQDVRAETFLRVLHAIRGNQLRSSSSLSAYILGTARNVMHEFARHRHLEKMRRSQESVEPSVPSHENFFVDSDVRRAIEQTIAHLKPRERELLRMHYYDELPRAEIARRSGISEERVRLVKSRALKHFREIYSRLNATRKYSARATNADTNRY